MKSALDVIYNLPQANHLADSRVSAFLKRLSELGEDTLWHAKRLEIIGGCEMGAFLRYLYPVFEEAEGEPFKTAPQIVAEKLLRQMPMRPTIQAQRGTNIEPLLRDVFHRKYGVSQFAEGFEATKRHASAPMGGNIDDSVYTPSRKKLLVDYKSGTGSFDKLHFDHVAQLHSYGATAKSNGVEFDHFAVFSIQGAEEALQSLAQITFDREKKPNEYEFWVNALVHHDMPGITLKFSPVKPNPELMAVTEKTSQHFFTKFVEQGKLLVPDDKVVLAPEVERNLEQLRGKGAQLLAAKQAAEQQLEALTKTIALTLLGIQPNRLKLADGHPVKIGSTARLDKDAAIEALAAEGITAETAGNITENIDIKLLAKAYKDLGGDIDCPSLRERVLNVKTIRAKLKQIGMDASIYESSSLKLAFSTSKKDKEEASRLIDQWSDRISYQHEDCEFEDAPLAQIEDQFFPQ